MTLPSRNMILTVALLVSLFWSNSSSVSADEVRTWTDATGKYTTEAELVSIGDQTVRLRKSDSKEIEIPISKLSKSDRDFLARQKPKTAIAKPEGVDGVNPKPTSEFPRVSVKQLQDEAKADIESYKEKWVGKIVEIEGLIGTFDWGERFGEGSSLVFVRERNDDIGLVCKGPDSSFRPWNHYQSGKQGIVRGKVTIGRADTPYLDAAEFVWSEGGGIPRINVNEIITAFVADAEAAKVKFHDQQFVISGKLLRRVGKPGDGRRAILQGNDGINFELHHMALEDFEDFEIGDNVYVIGTCEFGGIYLDHEKVGASMCERLPNPEVKGE